MILLGVVCGAGIALGLGLLVLGVRGTERPPKTRRSAGEVLATEPLALPAALAAAAALVVWIVTGWIVGALVAAGVALLAPRTRREGRAHVRLVERTEAIAAWAEMLRDTLAAAAGLEQAIVTAAPNAPDDIRAEVTALARRLDRGERLVVALRRLAADLANPAADLVVAALVTAAQREARDLVPLLGSLARSTRSEAEMRLRIHASRARLRTAVRVIVGSLGVFAGGLILFNPRYLEPYQSVTGQLVLLVVAAILGGSFVLLQRMAHLRAPDRFLTRVASDGVLEVTP